MDSVVTTATCTKEEQPKVSSLWRICSVSTKFATSPNWSLPRLMYLEHINKVQTLVSKAIKEEA